MQAVSVREPHGRHYRITVKAKRCQRIIAI